MVTHTTDPAAANAGEPGTGCTLAWRIWRPIWHEAATFQNLLQMLGEYPAAVDEVALFDHYVHVPGAPLADARDDADLLRQRLDTLREAGIGSVGINVLATLGHGMQTSLRPMPFASMTGPDGERSACCPCPNRAEFRDYIAEYYRVMAEAEPDFVWVDDDFRTVSHGVRYPCFCEVCIELFGWEGSRDSLVDALDEEEKRGLRQRWSRFWAGSIEELGCEIRRAVRAVDDGIEIGLMTVGYSLSTYAGYPIARWMASLGAVRGRPGHGFYDDERPRAVIGKALDVARQVRDYPARVKQIQYELENWPYITLDKSVQTALNECALAAAVGCNGVAFNVISEVADEFGEYRPLFEAVAGQRGVWETIVDAAAGLPMVGYWPADSPALMERRRLGGSTWFEEGAAYDIQRPDELAEMGLALTAQRESACGVLLAGRIAEAFSDEELCEMLSDAVLMDADALEVLWARGLGELTGVRPGRYVEHCYERLTDHPLNGSHAGAGRRTSPYAGARALLPVAEGVEDLAHAVGQGDGEDRGVCLSAFENGSGGRVAVSTYVPWRRLGRAGKRRQLLALADWLARGKLPIIIPELVRVAPFVRRSPDTGSVVAVLLNMSSDSTGPLAVHLRGAYEVAWQLSATGATPLEVTRAGGETVLSVSGIAPWQTMVLRADA